MSTEKNDAMHETYANMQCDAMQCNTHTKMHGQNRQMVVLAMVQRDGSRLI